MCRVVWMFVLCTNWYPFVSASRIIFKFISVHKLIIKCACYLFYFRTLLEYEAAVGAESKAGFTPLHLAAQGSAVVIIFPPFFVESISRHFLTCFPAIFVQIFSRHYFFF